MSHLIQRETQSGKFAGGRSPRRGFTLVELMVVIIIIGILGAMISAAAVGALKQARDASIKAEIDSLSVAVETYKSKYGTYPPNMQDLSAVTQHIYKLFPRCKDAIPRCYPTPAALESLFIRVANGTSAPANPAAFSSSSVTVWEQTAAIHALYFWLGGFFPDPEHPLQPPKDANGNFMLDAPRVSFFDFKPSRLRFTGIVYRPDSTTAATDLNHLVPLFAYYPERLDTPYVYFSAAGYDPRDPDPRNAAYSYPQMNNTTGDVIVGATGTMTPVHVRYARIKRNGVSGDDLSLLTNPFPLGSASPDLTCSVCLPYRYPPTDVSSAPSLTNKQSYVNPRSFQIICAGEDNMYSSIFTDGRSAPAALPGPIYSVDGVGDLTHNDLFTIYLTKGALWWYPTGKALTLAPTGGSTAKSSDEHRDNLTNFAKKRLDAEVNTAGQQ